MDKFDKNIDVSVIMCTYNHEKYISKALDSIIYQKHNLTIEILVTDDASTDATKDILKNYKNNYPELIKIKCNKVNTGYPTRSFYNMLKVARGKYIATIEGDDYWTSEYKLQKQYDFLENNKHFSGHACNIKVVNEDGLELKENPFYSPNENNVYTMEDFRSLKMPAMSISFFARNIYRYDEDISILYRADRMMGDLSYFMLCLLHGDIYQSDEVMAAYRYVCKDGGNNYNSINKENKYKEYNCLGYWIRLERYIRENKDSHYHLDIIKSGLLSYCHRYSAKAMLKILKELHSFKYLMIYLLGKSVIYYSNSYIDKVRNRKSWREFENDSSPLIIFGAGNIASIYLDEYAWKQDILFIVDNDKTKQNTSYKGFNVKKPDEILKQKRKCKILIANEKYEVEIEKQLIDMGITSYYCFCSMQSRLLANRLLKIL